MSHIFSHIFQNTNYKKYMVARVDFYWTLLLVWDNFFFHARSLLALFVECLIEQIATNLLCCFVCTATTLANLLVVRCFTATATIGTRSLVVRFTITAITFTFYTTIGCGTFTICGDIVIDFFCLDEMNRIEIENKNSKQ